MKEAINLQPRLLRLKDAFIYLGMAERVFNKHVRPYIKTLRIGVQGIAFDRLDLDAWVDHYKQRGQLHFLPNGGPLIEETNKWQEKESQDSLTEEESGTLTKKSSDNAFAKAVERAISKKQKYT